MPHLRSSFTLIELLIVIAIVAALAVTVILTLNPAQLLRQARDSNRFSDLSTIKTTLALYQTDVAGGSLGSSSVIYVSIPDPAATSTDGTDCSGIGLTSIPGLAYHCPASSTARAINGKGWIPVNFSAISSGAPFSQLPLDTANTTSSGLFYTYITDGTAYKITASTESEKFRAQASRDGGVMPNLVESGNNTSLTAYAFPYGWVKVPGNSTFGTSDFWVMKYNAKCVSSATSQPLTTPDTGYHTYANNSANCTSGNSKYAASSPEGYPIANISHDTAKTYCQSIGAHLLTNEEYMTIVRNAEQVGSNWSGGAPGNGYMYSGHNDNVPAFALTASTDDTDGYYGETNQGGNQRRTFTLANGNVVWDFAGNVWQHVQRTPADTQTAITTPSCSSGTGWQWCQYGNSTAPYITTYGSDTALSYVGPSNSSWNSSQGMGQVYTNSGAAGGTVFIRGASWDNGGGAGPFALDLLWTGGTTNILVGFRCAR